MAGKLPIDRVRDAEDAPRLYERDKRRFTEKQATLQQADGAPDAADAATPETSREPEDDHA